MPSANDALQSSQSFVRALKSAIDPPLEKGPSKIQIARLGWDSQSFYVPRKSVLILEWILTRFHKEKSKPSNENPLLDAPHWSLLADILAHPSDTHIVPLISRTSIPALVASFIALYPSIPPSSREALIAALMRSLNVLWPLAVQRAGIDPLSECFWTSLSVFDQIKDVSDADGLVDILTLVFNAFRSAFDHANAAGKKKAQVALVQHQLSTWLRAMHFLPPAHPLHPHLYSVGTDILLNPDFLRTSLDTNPNANVGTDLFSILFGPSTPFGPEVHSALLELLPSLYRDHITALRKHRSLIFSGATAGQQARERLRHAAVRFGGTSLAFLKNLEAEVGVLKSIWKARVGILRVTEEEALLGHTDGHEAADKIKEVGPDALKVLDRAWDDSQSHLVMQALEALACLHRIEPDMIASVLPQILERLATCSPGASSSALTFLSQLTSYHSKTRTLHTLISHLLSALSSSFPFIPSLDAHKTYRLCTRSPLLCLAFSDELSNALTAFVTPGQADEIVSSVHEALETSRPAREVSEEPAKKRRKVSTGGDGELRPASESEVDGTDAVQFALVARLGAIALGAVMQGGTKGDVAAKMRTALQSVDGLISGALETAFKTENGGSGKVSKKGNVTEKRARHEDERPRWTRECLCAALLRLWYDLFARSGAPWIDGLGERSWGVPNVSDGLYTGFISCLHQVDVLPELQLEIGRVLYACRTVMWRADRNQDAKGWTALDAVINYVEANLFTGDADFMNIDSEERPPTLSRRDAALALWSLTVERYLPSIDAHASQMQLDRLASLMIRARFDTSLHDGEHQPSGASVLARALASANFWELGNIRTSMLAVLDKQTAGFASIEVERWLSAVIKGDHKTIKALSKANAMSWDGIEAGIAVYHLLHSFPPEYLSRASRVELAKRALAADVLVQAIGPKGVPDSQGVIEPRAILRSFVVIVARQTQTKTLDEIASVQDWMPYLTLSNYAPQHPTEAFVSSTLNILSLLHMSAMRAAVNSDGMLLANILTRFVQLNPFVNNITAGERLAQQSLLRFVGTLVREFKMSSFSENMLHLLRRLCGDLDGALRTDIGIATAYTAVTDFVASGHVIEAWQVVLSLKQWLSIEPDGEAFGEMLLAKTSRIIGSRPAENVAISEEFRASVLSLLIEQGQMRPATECQHVDTIVAAYILFTKSTHQDVSACDALMTRASKLFSVKQFEAILELIGDALENGTNDQSEDMSLLRLSTLLLREAPERTSKFSHEHVTRCLRIFLNRPAFTRSTPPLAAQVLDFIHYQCAERAASLKTFDTACIWSILSKLLTGCSEHDESTSTIIFQTMVSIVNALVRLRRDLLGPHLPQLSMVLRQLMMAIRGVRPLLGLKQHRLVSDTLPRWINSECPLGEMEAQSMARLLTVLTTKSLVRSHAFNDTQKAESLARPFARHAPYVLLAYIQLMNDPLSILSITMRRELEPGLFALCNMMGEHGRDTLMVQSLDVGGKAMLKSLWKKYDKQRYVGRG